MLTQTGLADPTFISYLTIFALLSVALIVIKNFSRPGTVINLVSGLALISLGIIFFLILGGTNASQPRLGYLRFFIPAQGSKIAVTVEFVSLVLIWIGVAVLKATNLSLGFIEARRSKPSLKLPHPVQKVVAPAQVKP
jgi:hypothetical protein